MLIGSNNESAHQTDTQNIEKNYLKISSNQAYISHHAGGAEEIIYSYPQINFDSAIEAKHNEAYTTNIVTLGNEAYAASIAL